jgi:dihydrofolate reductase
VGKVNFDISMSLDGYIAAANQRPGQPMGDGGERLHEWAFGDDPRDREVLEQGVAGSGAVICGRRTYDDSLPWWGADGPTGPARLPVIVVTHSVPHAVPEGSVYTFVTAGIEAALEQAQVVAGDKDVTVMGGAETGQRDLAAGMVDELSVHLVPVLLGNGLRMFDNLGVEPITLENTTAIQTAVATHLRLRVVR